MKLFALSASVVFLAALDVRASVYIQTTVSLYAPGNGSVVSVGTAQLYDSSTTPIAGVLTGSHVITPSYFASIYSGSGAWYGTASTWVLAGTCYRATVEAYSGDAYQGAGSPQICFSSPPPPPTPRPPGVIASCGDPSVDCPSPLVLNLGGGDWRLSGLEDPIAFNLATDDRRPESIGWTARGAALAFLALDRNGNGRIDDGGELFGNYTRLRNGERAANGFAALAEFDSNRDGVIDVRDEVWPRLLLWQDRNHDGRTDAGELERVASSSVRRLGLQYQASGQLDTHGNAFRFEGSVWMGNGSALQPYFDVYFAILQPR